MIFPRATTPRANTMGNYTPAEWDRFDTSTRPVRYCPCGTKLRSTKPLHRGHCDACEDKKEQPQTPRELHPDVALYEPCPHCGDKMSRGSNQCRTCQRDRIRRLAI